MESLKDNKPMSNLQGQTAGPCVMVIFGASGDLTKRKLIPGAVVRVQGAEKNYLMRR